MSILSFNIPWLESVPSCNGLDLLSCWWESQECRYLLYTGSQVLKAVQWKRDVQYASYKKGESPTWDVHCHHLLISFTVFCVAFLFSGALLLYSQTQLVTKINSILLFQKPVPFPLNFSRFQGMGSDVFWLSVNSTSAPLSGLHILWP